MEFAFGILFGVVVALMIFLSVGHDYIEGKTIEQVKSGLHDCLNPYYYYGDDGHKTFCDKIAVKPAGNTTGTTGGQ